MGLALVPVTILSAIMAFAVGVATVGLTPYRPAWWPAAMALVVLGGIAPMIYAVNFRIVPVFARRTWPSIFWLRAQIALAVSGAWLVYIARIGQWDRLETAGHALALGGGITFTLNLTRLFRQKAPPSPSIALPVPEGQEIVDRLARRFTRIAGVYLLVGLLVGLWTSIDLPETGRWDLVWAHALLVGFFLSMACGVCYHVLGRWTGKPWRAIWPIRLHLLTTVFGLPLMLLALAVDGELLFYMAAPLQAVAIALFIGSAAPAALALPNPTRIAFLGALLVLLFGIALGASFAVEPALGARLRQTHAELNLFGWTGLLVTGFGYYLVPRFAGNPVRWSFLVKPQLASLAGGVAIGAASFWWRAYGEAPEVLTAIGNGFAAFGFLLFGFIVAGTFRHRPAPAPLMARTPYQILPMVQRGKSEAGD